MPQALTSENSLDIAWVGFRYGDTHPLTPRPRRTLAHGVLVGALLLASNGPCIASPFDSLLKTVSNAIPFNPFDTKGNAFNKLVDSQENQKAIEYFDENYAAYFDERFNKKNHEVTSQLQKLGQWSYEKTYGERSTDILNRLREVTQLKDNTSEIWSTANASLEEAGRLVSDLGNDKLLSTSRLTQAYISPIQTEIDRVQDIAKRDRPLALATTFDEVFKTGQVRSNYPYQGFTETDYIQSGAFQMRIYNALSQLSGSEQIDLANRVARVSSDGTVDRIAREAKLQKLLAKLGTGPYSLESLSDLRAVAKEFGSESAPKGGVKIGYFDLNLPLLNVPLSHPIMRPSTAVPRASFFQTALG